MKLHCTLFACLCIVLASKGDQESKKDERGLPNSSIRGAKTERHLAPIEEPQVEELKTYIVVFNETESTMTDTANTSAYSMADSIGGEVMFEYNTVLKGVAVKLTPTAAAQLNTDEAIELVVEDVPEYLYTTNWGHDRIDQSDLPLDGRFSWEDNTNAGAGVNVCVIDSGIDEDYLGSGEMNIAGGEDFIGGGSGGVYAWNDCVGHGTHVAGTIGSRLYGVAPGATLWVARVFDCEEKGAKAITIRAIDWCAQKAREIGGKWIANLSLGGAYNQLQNTAIANARSQGIVMVVAAGNDSVDACQNSPASEPSAITVAASTSLDNMAGFSNYGSCVDVYAPGKDIISHALKDALDPGYLAVTKSGTSMAAPHVAGVAALFFQSLNTANEVEAALRAAAVPGRISYTGGSPNLLVQVPTPTKAAKSSKEVQVPKQAKAGKAAKRR